MRRRTAAESADQRQATEITALTERLYAEVHAILSEFPQLRVEDYDLSIVREHILAPVASYLVVSRAAEHDSRFLRGKKADRGDSATLVKPIFVSGPPGIGKTTLLMVLDEALSRLTLNHPALPQAASCREIVGTGEMQGYFPDKGSLPVTPLKLFGLQTAVISARDWNDVLRFWTFDEETARENPQAIRDFIRRLRGKVVIVDEAELEGYVYFTELLAKNGILAILTSNLGAELVHLSPDMITTVVLSGPDHRQGDIKQVVLPAVANQWFDMLSGCEPITTRLLAGSDVRAAELQGKTLVYLRWRDLQNQPLLKDDFARFFRQMQPDLMLLDGVPFFSEIKSAEIDLGFLGHLFRFVNFVDAIHDSGLPLLVRGTHPAGRDLHEASQELQAALVAYDARVGDTFGHTAWIEWGRCLSRLKSRQALNRAVWNASAVESKSQTAL